MSSLTQVCFNLVYLVPILTLLGAMVNGAASFGGGKISKPLVSVVACGALFASFVLSAGAFLHLTQLPDEAREITVTLFSWLQLGGLKADIAFLIDPLSLTMMLVVTGVGSLIHLYSVGYMHDDPGYARYFAYLNLFCFAMLTLVMGKQKR